MTEKDEFPSDKADKFVVRFPDGMRDCLKEAAHANNRSMNAEIVARLSASLEREEGAGVKLVGKIGDGPSIVDEVARALEGVQDALAELRAIKRIELPEGTPVRSDPMAFVRPFLEVHSPEAPRRKVRPKTSIAGSKRLRRTKHPA